MRRGSERLPVPGAPVIGLEGGEGFFIVVVAGFDGGVARVEIAAAGLPGVGNFVEEGADAEAAGGGGGLEHGIDAGAGIRAEIEIADGEQLTLGIGQTDFAAFAGFRGGGGGGKEDAQGVRDVGFESFAVAEKEGFAPGVDLGGADFDAVIGVLFEDSPVPGGGLEIRQDQAQGLDAVPASVFIQGKTVTEKAAPEMTPALAPARVHFLRGSVREVVLFKDDGREGHVGRGKLKAENGKAETWAAATWARELKAAE